MDYSPGLQDMYKSYIRPHLKYCVQVRSTYLVAEITTVERVQRRATKLVQGLQNVPYEDRLKKLGLYLTER